MVAMNEIPLKLKARADRKDRKRQEKKRQIAESAIEALKELGYANTSLRDIAANSDQSLGMLHYYFEDKIKLIKFCVENYKAEFVRDLTEALENADGRDAVIEAFSGALVKSIVDDEATHRLWYDIRTQAMFDPIFSPLVSRIENSLIDVVRTAFTKAGHDAAGNYEIQYALLDGVFRYIMHQQIIAKQKSREEIKTIFKQLLEQFL